MNYAQAAVLVTILIYIALQLTMAGLNLARISDGLAGIREELARLRKMVP